MFSWNEIPSRPLIIAHRGASAEAPENTLVSFERAIRQGADAVELDVRLTKDEAVVVIHDATLSRTTDGRGRVSEHTLEQLKKFDAGSWFHRRYKGEYIPTLAEVLDLVDGKVGINIEIKPVVDQRTAIRIVERSLGVVKDFRAEEEVLITSFQHLILKIVRKFNRRVTLGILYHPLQHFGKSPVALARRYDARVIVCAHRFLRRPWVTQAHAQRIAVASYIVETKKTLSRCLQYGIRGIITNRPEEIKMFLGRNA